MKTYPESVNFILGEYAKDSLIEDAVADFESNLQKNGENEKKFDRRIKSKNLFVET